MYLNVTNNLTSSILLILISVYLLLILGLLTSYTSIIVAQTNEIQIGEKRNETTEYDNSLKNGSEFSINNGNFSILNPPSISPNPVGSGGWVNISMNHTQSGIAIDSIIVNIRGPNLGSTNPRLTPAMIGSISMHLASGSERDGLWSGNFTFPNSLPDGNYLYSLVITDSKSKVRTIGPYSGIILDRNPPDSPETMIVSAIDSDGKAISNGGNTSSSDIKFTFDGRDNTGVVQSFECNLDDLIIFSEHEHVQEEDPDQVLSAYSSCFSPMKISAAIVGDHAYVNLGAGNHTFKVRVVDNEYDFDTTPANFSWNILPAISH